ncbi:hypothetical protein J2754_003039 [Halarchaeum solikamskense]|uniref:HalOD1 output domain-containing protein n=1 Tax=Halarchaeum nitratireducens TaxID=489913 RepID=UPI001B3AC122|nr:HalOD1 output domain-containing protein [Halarchaeum solikamskense]MBP2252693.1 hypothetical protein [Halarchaeum solikamskense]
MNIEPESRVQFVTYDKQPSIRVVEAVAALEGVEQEELPPLQETVDVDALDTVYSTETEAPLSTSVLYNGYQILIRSTGTIWLQKITASRPERTPSPRSTLVLAPTGSTADTTTCRDLSVTAHHEHAPLLRVLLSTGDDRTHSCETADAHHPSRIDIISCVDDFTVETPSTDVRGPLKRRFISNRSLGSLISARSEFESANDYRYSAL